MSPNVLRAIERPLFVFRKAILVGFAAALAALSWLPPKAMTRTFLGGHAEHLLAYLGTAVVLGLAFSRSPRPAVQCALLMGYAAFLEAGQIYTPGRHASIEDFAFSSSGILLGALLLWIARSRFRAAEPGDAPGE